MVVLVVVVVTIMAAIMAETAGYDFHRQVKLKPWKSNEV
jgi:hypothetical protein